MARRLWRVALLLGLGVVVTPPGGAAATLTFLPVADAYVRSGSDAGRNFGTATSLRARGGSTTVKSYLKFTVTGISGPAASAKLRLVVTDASVSGGDGFRVPDTSWTETGITYANAPPTSGAALSTLGSVAGGAIVELDLGASITRNGTYSFALTSTSSDVVRYSSREGANPPLLVLEASTEPAPPVNTSPPTISGLAQVGETLLADPGTWTGSPPISYTYQWQRCSPDCADVAGATGQAYLLLSDDLGATIQVVVTATNSVPPPVTATSARTAAVTEPGSDPLIAAAGDIACDPSNSSFNGGLGTATACRALYTSDLLLGTGLAAVLPLGDNQYECGGLSAYLQSYDLSWGRAKPITRPAPGSHEYKTSGGTDCSTGASGYFAYFGAVAGEPGKGYYSYDLGSWHVIVLNSECARVGGCGPGSPQEQWLRADLAAHPAACTLAYWHRPRFSSKTSRATTTVDPFWQALYSASADVILNAHAHMYERFAPQSPSGALDPAAGIREFVVGTGGSHHHTFSTVAANSEVREADTFGVLKLTLHLAGYDWAFVPEAGGSFTDSGSASCH